MNTPPLTADQLAQNAIPWDRATTDAVGLPWDAVHNTRDIARAAYAKAIHEVAEPLEAKVAELRLEAERLRKALEGIARLHMHANSNSEFTIAASRIAREALAPNK